MPNFFVASQNFEPHVCLIRCGPKFCLRLELEHSHLSEGTNIIKRSAINCLELEHSQLSEGTNIVKRSAIILSDCQQRQCAAALYLSRRRSASGGLS